jgi:hypothetical protein
MRLALWMGLAGLVALGCGKSSSPSEPGATGASASPSVPPPPMPSVAPAGSAATSAEPTCRALRVEGDAKVAGVPVSSGATLDGAEWLELAAGASLTLKHTTSGRELAVSGPALLRPCRRGREQLLLARGKVQAGAGMGARPGAEVLIATPIAAVRYADAEYSLALDEKRLAIELRAGQVELDASPTAPAAVTRAIKSPLRGAEKLSLALGKPSPTEAMARCKEAAEAAEASARAVGDKTSSTPLGERAQAHVKARRTARSACTIAAATTGLVADPESRAGLWAEAVRWEGLWETIPRRGIAQAPEK